MADFNALEALINAYIKQNGVKAITGNVLNGVLRGMVSALGKGWTIADGDATPTTDPGTMTGPIAYIAHTAGTYEHFGNLVVNDGEVALLKYNEQTWTKEVIASLAASASVDGNVGTPSVGVSWVNGVLTFDFRNMKGNPGINGTDGQDGAAAGFGTVSASVDNTVGTPAVSVQSSGPNTAKNFAFSFTGLKGETGVTSVVVTVDNTSGTPSCSVSLVGQVLHLDFTGLKGAQGDTGSSVDYPFTIVNNLTTNDATQALSAAMGVELAGQVSQLEAKVDDISTGKYYGYYATASDLPEDVTVDGFAYVGSGPTYTIYNCEGGVWTSSGITVNQSPVGNDEDIDQNEDGKLQFANRVYNAQQPNGMGYKILRKDATFASQVNATNTIYEIRYDFSLGGESIQLPSGICLKFVGGSINNGTIVLSSNVSVVSESSLSSPNNNLVLLVSANITNVVIQNIRFTGDGTKERAINHTGQYYITNLSIRGCEISGYYYGGISMNARNALYDGNLVFGCGTSNSRENAVDLLAGYVSIENVSKTPNIIICNNRLLSNNVDRHIDVGELYSETNIIITGNTCVGMKDDLSAEEPNSNNRHGIMVGYTGTSSDTDRYAIISNNIVKYGHWGGIYVRANNNAENVDISKYLVNITGNIISGIITDGGNHVTGGLAIEVKAGSIIANNVIENCTCGINLGFMYSDMDALVSANTISSISTGVTIDTTCRRLKVCNNQIRSSAGTGISVSPTTTMQTDDLHNAKLDICSNNIDAAVNGIYLYNVTASQCIVMGNVITSPTLGSGSGVDFYPLASGQSRIVLNSNHIRNYTRGIQLIRNGYRAENCTIIGNILNTCTTGISVVNASSLYIVTHTNTRFINCTTNASVGVYAGSLQNDRLVLLGMTTVPWAVNTNWKRGDIVFGITDANLFDMAVCITSSTITDGAPVSGTSKWRVYGYRTTTAGRTSNQTSLFSGTKCYDTNMNRMFTWNGSYWITDDGFIAERKKGTSAQRPTLVSAWAGYQYYDTDLKKQILWNGTAWVNMDGTALS